MKSVVSGLACLLALCGCATRPSFVPKPGRAFERFSSLRELRTAVPVGALWIEDYGPHGDGAAPDNLITETSLRGVTFDNDIRATLTLGFLQFLDLDPSYRSKVTARFNDLIVLRVKDMSKLAGAQGHPRIYAALKAGTITITTVNDMGLDIEGRIAARNMNVIGRGSTGQARTFTIDAKDMFLAVQIADANEVARSQTVHLEAGRDAQVRFEGFTILLRVAKEASGNRCTIQVAGGEPVAIDRAKATVMTLPVPAWRGGALFTSIKVESKDAADAADCGKSIRNVSLLGTRMRLLSTNGMWRER